MSSVLELILKMKSTAFNKSIELFAAYVSNLSTVSEEVVSVQIPSATLFRRNKRKKLSHRDGEGRVG